MFKHSDSCFLLLILVITYRYGDPDPELHHEYDMSMKLRMSAVQYVHTKRFQSELMAFINHFSQLQESLRRMRIVEAGNQVIVVCLIPWHYY